MLTVVRFSAELSVFFTKVICLRLSRGGHGQQGGEGHEERGRRMAGGALVSRRRRLARSGPGGIGRSA